MSEVVILELPNALAQRAHVVAMQNGRRVEDVLIEWLDRAVTEAPIKLLPDEEVLALRDLELEAAQQAELSELLARQREGELVGEQRGRLDNLMESEWRGMVRKAQARWTAASSRR